jgi:hypothetical protein
MAPELTPHEAESLRSGWLPPSAVPKVSPAMRHYYGIGAAAAASDEPVPYSLTPAAEAALDDPEARGPYPGSGDPERLAQWCGFPAMAAMEAACEADAREQAAQSAMEARWEAGVIAEDPEAEPWP